MEEIQQLPAHMYERRAGGDISGQVVLERGQHLPDVEGEVVVLVGKVLVEGGAADGGPVAQLAHGQFLKAFFVQQLREGQVQGLIGFLQPQINFFLHKKPLEKINRIPYNVN